MSEVKVVRRTPKDAGYRATPVHDDTHPQISPADIDVVAIGASAGGPLVIQSILNSMQKDFPFPILIVQHIAAGFLSGMVDWLAETSGVPLQIAADGEILLPGRAYFAPDGFNVGVRPDGRTSSG